MAKMPCPIELKFFLDYEDDVIADFVAFAFEYVNNNIKNKAYVSAAHKLGTDAATVEHIVSKLVFLLLESIKLKLSERDFLECCDGILPVAKAAIVWNGLNERRDKLAEVLATTGIDHLHYGSLDWRLEYVLASRTLRNQKEINVDLSLNLKRKEDVALHRLSTDVPNLIHMTRVLESALFETKSSHVRKVQRAFK